ncbi:hypothetical protein BGW36DRAFT_380740 [Talaromyces proteolyticus]|uniref:Kinase n=1 Tax=Talaromyces proteolyticus TaxID=1131652 RepID=A0AAD4KPU7_9EURO|nr:uncharacterized protein BGW36DRAFT_380740 [Talaromyces proteolyticus]KAH8696348.1 hypothetical protein BGW36DRAFT_380740 [Talaromyces proteolyticus]
MSRPGSATGHAPPGSLVTPAAFNSHHDCPVGDLQSQGSSLAELVHSQSELEHERHQQFLWDNSSADHTATGAPSRRTARAAAPPITSTPANPSLKRASTTPSERWRPSPASSNVGATHAFRSQTPQLSERDSIFATHYLPSDNNDVSAASTPPLLPVRESYLSDKKIPLKSTLGGAPRPSAGSAVSSTIRAFAQENSPTPPSNLASHSSTLRHPSDLVLQTPSTPLAGSHVGWVKQQETVESSKVAGTHRIAIRETFHPLRKIVSEGKDNDSSLSNDPEGPLLPSTSSTPLPRLQNIPMVDSSNVDHERAFPDSWHTTRHLDHGDGKIDVTWNTKFSRSSSRGRTTRVEESIEANLTNAEPAAHVRSRKSSHYLGLFKENTSPDRKRREDRERHLEDVEEQTRMEEDQESPLTPRPAHATLHKLAPVQPTEAESPETEAAQSPTDVERIVDINADLSPHPLRTLPRNLAEEIRNFHLTTGGDRGGSFSPSVPTRYTEIVRNESQGSNESHSVAYFDDSTPPRQNLHPELGIEEDDDEHISSALYFPHESAPSGPEASFTKYRRDSEGYTLTKQAGLDAAEDESLNHVDISLRSQKESSILHGDYQPLSDAEDKALATISEYSHESTSESEAESTLSTQDELSSLTDDADHMAATPTQTQRPLRHRRKHTKTGLIGAVELKPYRHQVGGHTTVFRFSRRAVCKQLNNRENEFYERIERRHPEMLMFLPRSIFLSYM